MKEILGTNGILLGDPVCKIILTQIEPETIEPYLLMQPQIAF